MIKEQSKYELWISEDGSYDFFLATNQSARSLLGKNAKLINVIEAASWEEARQKQREFLGWGGCQQLPR